jgi:hypothetical protein
MALFSAWLLLAAAFIFVDDVSSTLNVLLH